MCLDFVETRHFMLNICFPFGSLEIWHVLDRGCLCDQLAIKNLGGESIPGFPGQKHGIHGAVFSLLGEKVLCVTLHGKKKQIPLGIQPYDVTVDPHLLYSYNKF